MIESPLEKWDRRFLSLAEEISTWSKDPSTKIGAVIVDPKTRRILSTGYNGFPSRINDFKSRYENKEDKYKFVIHAEMNAIYNATANGINISRSTLYCTGLPTCSDCAKGIIQCGVDRVVNGFPKDIPTKWKDHFDITKEMFEEADVELAVYHKWKTK